MLRAPSDAAEDREAGFTLIEMLVALSILAIAVVVLVGALSSLLIQTQHQRGLSGTDTVVRDWGEAVKADALTRTDWPKCPQWADLDPGFTFPSGYAAASSPSPNPSVEYWIPNVADPQTGSFTSSRALCTNTGPGTPGYYENVCGAATRPECDPGVVRVTMTVEATAGDTRGGRTTTQVLVRRGNR